MPNSVLFDVTIDHENMEILFIKDGILVSYSTQGWNKASCKWTSAGAVKAAKKYVGESVILYKMYTGRASAQTSLENLICQWNPGADDLKITVEYLEDDIYWADKTPQEVKQGTVATAILSV